MSRLDLPEVVITGVGVVSPIGIGSEEFWQSLTEGRSGVTPLETFETGALSVPVGGQLLNFDAKKLIKPRKVLKLMCTETRIAYYAATLAMQHAGLSDSTEIAPERFGVVCGSEMLYGHPSEMVEVHKNSIIDGKLDMGKFAERMTHDMFPLWMLNYLPNMPACHIGIAQNAAGANNTIVLGGVSSLLSIIEAFTVIQRGWADVMIAGGTGAPLNLTRRLYQSDEGLSKTSEQSPRPFDATRDGRVLGEGSALFILESRQHAHARGQRALASISGFSRVMGAVDDNYGGATTKAIGRSITTALADANVAADELDHVNANASGSVPQDRREALAIREHLGDTPVLAAKSYFGDLGAAAGAIELAATVLGFGEGEVARTINFSQPDPACPVNVIREMRSVQGSHALALSQSTSGQAAGLVLSR